MNRSTLKIIFVVAGIWFVGLLVALYAPADILARSSLARAYVDGVEFCWPLLRGYVQKSGFQEVALLYNSIVWLALPCLVVLVWRYLKSRTTGLLVKEKLTVLNWLVLAFVCAFLAAIGIVFLIFWNGANVRLVNFATSRLSLGVWGMAQPLGVAVFLTPGAAALKKLLTGRP